MHELLHALGLVHEQINPKSSLKLRLARIQTGMESEYTDESAVALTDYDPDSIMGYSSYDATLCDSIDDPKWTESSLVNDLPHSKCRRTDWKSVIPSPSNSIDCRIECASILLGETGIIERQRERMTPKDIEGLRALYGKSSSGPFNFHK